MIDPDTIPVANPSDYNFNHDPMPLFLFAFGATRVYAWGCHTLDDALEAAAEWLLDNEPGAFCEPDYTNAAERIGAPVDWYSKDNIDYWDAKVTKAAEEVMTYTESGYLIPSSWTVSEITDADTVAAVRAACVAELEK